MTQPGRSASRPNTLRRKDHKSRQENQVTSQKPVFNIPRLEFISGMENKIDSTGVLAKIRASGCLDDGEMNLLMTHLSALETRLELDALDERWSLDIRKYLWRGRRGSVSLPTRDDALGIAIVGVLMVLCGGVMLTQFQFDETTDYLPAAFFAFIGVAGVYTMFRNKLARDLWKNYRAEFARYQEARRAIGGKLPVGYRPAKQICRLCLSTIGDVENGVCLEDDRHMARRRRLRRRG